MKTQRERQKELQAWIDEVEDRHLHALLAEIFDGLFLESFLTWPGATWNHHTKPSGLFAHTTEVLEVVWVFCDLYPSLNRDLALTIALLHDIGKVRAYSGPIGANRTLEGHLLDHLVMSVIEVANALRRFPTFPGRLKAKVLHGIVSHHGKKEQGSPVAPMIPEAVLVYYADHLSAAVTSTLEAVVLKRKGGRSDSSPKDVDAFTGRNVFTGTRLYCG